MDTPSALPQWTTTSRLLKLGECIAFQFFLPAGAECESLAIFPRYLELAHPEGAFIAGGDLNWLDALESEKIELSFHDQTASVAYLPGKAGNYLARWRASGETFYRYFSVIEDDWIAVRFSPLHEADPEPTLHATGIPLDYRLPVAQLDPEDPLFRKLLSYHRHYGDTIILELPETPALTVDERVKAYGQSLDKLRRLLPDANDARSARIGMSHDLDPGYTETLARLGVNDRDGMASANAKPLLGMPEFPYFASPVDCRKVSQAPGGALVAHQWDFCGGWHFIGPVTWHYAVAEGRWEETEKCLRQCLDEARNLTEMNGHPAFLLPLYDACVRYPGYPNPQFREGWNEEPQFQFVDRFQTRMAFKFTKDYKLAFCRSVDIADYYRRHFTGTPRTVFVSRTDHLLYDMWWLNHWAGEGRLVPRERIPWQTRISTIMDDRRTRLYYKDPLSVEYISVEDHRRQIRFERESPNPIWWFDYTVQEQGSEGSAIAHVETPDVEVRRSPWQWDGDSGLTITLRILTEAEFPNYAIALWGLPASFSGDPSHVASNAAEFIVAKNTDGEFHLILFFDLKPDAEIRVTLHESQYTGSQVLSWQDHTAERRLRRWSTRTGH